jgi:hypothetical protein
MPDSAGFNFKNRHIVDATIMAAFFTMHSRGVFYGKVIDQPVDHFVQSAYC